MSHASILTCSITCSSSFSCYGAKVRATFSCSIIISIFFCKSTAIVTTSLVDVFPISTPIYTCSSLTLHIANNATSSTLACTCCIFLPNLLHPWHLPCPFINSIVACCSFPSILIFFKFVSTKNAKTKKKNKNHRQLIHFKLSYQH